MQQEHNSQSGKTGREQTGNQGIPDTQKIVQKHLQDEHHVISEEEMQQVTISTDHIDPHIQENLEQLPEPDKADGKDTDLDDRVVTPWDVTT